MRPHRVRQWLHTPDPDFEEKAKRVCELYLNPPPGAVVLCIDEKPARYTARTPKLANLVALCTFRHTLVHESGWRVELSSAESRPSSAPDGSLLEATCTPPPAPADALRAFETEHAELEVDDEPP